MKNKKNKPEVMWAYTTWRSMVWVQLPDIKLKFGQRFIVAYRALFKGFMRVKLDRDCLTKEYQRFLDED